MRYTGSAVRPQPEDGCESSFPVASGIRGFPAESDTTAALPFFCTDQKEKP